MGAPQVHFTLDDPESFIAFGKYEQLIEWLQAEQEKWSWIFRKSPANVGAQMGSEFGTLINRAIQERDAARPLSVMEGLVAQAYRPEGWLRYSENEFGKSILEIRESKAGNEGAAFAYAFAKQAATMQDARTPQHLLGAILLTLPEVSKPADIGDRLRAERGNYRSAITKRLAELDDQERLRQDAFAKENAHGRSALAKLIWARRTKDRRYTKSVEERFSDAVAGMQAVEQTYRAAMGLQAPVEYWTTKASKHEQAERAAVNRLKWFFPLAALAFVGAFYGAADILLSRSQVAQAVYVIVAAGLGTVAALIFWVGRLLTKLYLSQHHLRHDAEERAVMTTTYLALTHEAAASEEDKKIILAALFRPTADGLVKDDGPPDASLAALLSKLGTGR